MDRITPASASTCTPPLWTRASTWITCSRAGGVLVKPCSDTVARAVVRVDPYAWTWTAFGLTAVGTAPVRQTRGPFSFALARRRSRSKRSPSSTGSTQEAQTKGWPEHEPNDALEYARLFVSNPFPTQEWCYRLDGVLIGVGYVDVLARGLSAIYFAHDPIHGGRSLGTWNVLSLIDRARVLGVPHLYLGYAAEGSASLRYKTRFRPNQSLDIDGEWRDQPR